MMSKDNYTIVITGATKGLGRALAEQYIQMGHMVIGCGRSVNSIKLMSNSYKHNSDFQVVDISNHKQVRTWAKDLLIKFGSPDFLLNKRFKESVAPSETAMAKSVLNTLS